jgi:RND family efflux transporter MFP subunit
MHDSSAAPQLATEPVKLQPVSPSAPPGRPLRIIVAVVLIVAVAAGAWFLRRQRQPKPAGPVIRTVRALRGAMASTIRLSGSISAKRFVSISAPMMQGAEGDRGLVLLYLPPNGSAVREGQTIAQIDGQNVKDHVDDLTAQISQNELDLRRLAAEQLSRLEAEEQRVRTARANLDKARQDLRAGPVRNAIDRQRLELALEEAQAEYDAARREQAMVREQQAAEKRIADLNQLRQVKHRDRHQHDLDRFTLRAPMDGQVVLKTIRRQGQPFQVQVGDQLAPGQPFMRVVDLSKLQLEATMNQVESEYVRIGQPATVHFDAYPDIVLKGRVDAVGTIAVAGSRWANNYVRQIPVRILLDDRDPRVFPDLTASADVVVADDGEGLLVPREAVHEEGGKSVVYVKQGDAVTPREVELGPANNTQVSVISGVQAGEEIVLQPSGTN